ncbi:MAG: bifunctional 3-demethylubiquinol 3-O-methyltransferase/2-polyprenyl-6-hydroxyphenol methylase [Pseudomonadales bacterium]|nr:bifunctional 3-demethylubiquinol 3-O-methyltransferase/2-polyprenyl-6-hydroxyphenol methylase [Pseudomonadales bacterium]RLU02842.1 MAG: bifunctional 2-polyprenyl-6-hydroxyphenol methylase/3-demethylubiquinol 3-O-methyltransferase UbiG [Ketobacter sp.]
MTSSSTTDADEIERFNQLAATWWDTSGPMWPLHLLNQFRVQLILAVLTDQRQIDPGKEHPLTGFTALDIGCGGGILSEALAKLGANVTGVDMAEKNVAIARHHATQNKLDIRYLCQEVSGLDEQFDLVFNMEVVEHVSDLETFLNACCERVQPGGMMFLSTINRTWKSYLFAILGAEYVLNLLPKGTHQWSKFVSPQKVEALFQQHSLDTIWQTGVSLNPFKKRYSPTQSMAVNYMLAARKGGTKHHGSTTGI